MAAVVQVSDAIFTFGAVDSAEDCRLGLAAAWHRGGSGLGVRTGVVYAGTSSLITATATTAPSMTVQVAPLFWVGQKAVAEGCYVGGSPSTVTVDIAAAPGSNSRIDVVYAMQRDAASPTSPDSITQGEVGVVTGTAGVSPAKPSIPVGAVEVGTVTVASGATKTTDSQVTIATTCLWTSPLGTPLPVRNQSERDALTQYDGLTVNRLDMDYNERSNGTIWVPAVPTWAGTEAMLVGTTPTAGKRRIEPGVLTATATTNSSGGWAIGIPSGQFPNGYNAVAMIGDTAGSPGSVILKQSNCTLTSLQGIAYQPAGAVVASTLIRLTYILSGW